MSSRGEQLFLPHSALPPAAIRVHDNWKTLNKGGVKELPTRQMRPRREQLQGDLMFGVENR